MVGSQGLTDYFKFKRTTLNLKRTDNCLNPATQNFNIVHVSGNDIHVFLNRSMKCVLGSRQPNFLVVVGVSSNQLAVDPVDFEA